MIGKLIVHFSGPQKAKKFVQRVKELPYVTYATDYSSGGSHSDVMVCGDLNDERVDFIMSLKKCLGR